MGVGNEVVAIAKFIDIYNQLFTMMGFSGILDSVS